MEFKELPNNWKRKATPLSGQPADDFRRWAGNPGKIIIDDLCPGQSMAVVIDEEGRVFRITDAKLNADIINSSRMPGIIKLLSIRNTSEVLKVSQTPSLN